MGGGDSKREWMPGNKQQAGSGQASPTGSLRTSQFQTPVVPSRVGVHGQEL